MRIPSPAQPILSVESVSKVFGGAQKQFWAVRDVSLDLHKGECVAIVGESGSGKSTLARLVLGLAPATSGRVLLEGRNIAEIVTSRKGRQWLSARMQMVFQDPHGSLDPAMRIGRIVAEPLRILGWPKHQIERRVAEVLDLVGLPGDYIQRRPRELSGGQRQRIGIARALGPRPQVLLLDEPVASLDVSIQGQILRLLKDIQTETDIAVLVIAHDLGVVRAIADRTLVMYAGRIVEAGTTSPVFEAPLHPYTAVLLWSATAEERSRMDVHVETALAREPPGAVERMHGCVFRSRCWRTIERCEETADRIDDGRDHLAYCNVPLDPPDIRRQA